MDPIVFVLVAGAAVLHVTWNVLLKTAGDPLRAAGVGMASAAAVIVPAAAIGWVATGMRPIPIEAVGVGALSGLLEGAYFVLLAAAYRRGDLSVVYPIARGTAPLLAVAVGIGILQERLGTPGIVGVGALLGGLLLLQRPWRFLRRGDAGRRGGLDPAVGFALATGVMIAAYSAVDRVGARLVEPWLYAGLIWAFGSIFLWGWILVANRAPTGTPAPGPGSAPSEAAGVVVDETARLDVRRAAVGGWITLAAYLLILVAFSVAPLTAVAPLRESAIVLASGWGTLRLGEGSGGGETVRRLAASALVVLGAVLLAIDG